jgi:hypothetical protein
MGNRQFILVGWFLTGGEAVVSISLNRRSKLFTCRGSSGLAVIILICSEALLRFG